MRGLAFLLVGLVGVGCAMAQEPVKVVVKTQPLFTIDRRVFGHFLERPSWGGEIGVEAAVRPGTHELDPRVVALLKGLDIPVLRFPGGTDVDYIDWTDMISNLPGRGEARPVTRGHQGGMVTNAFGIDEFLRLCESQRIEPLLVVNFRDGLLGIKPLDEAAQHAAALFAYCNGKVGGTLPEKMEWWAKIRALNGRPTPYKVKYAQVGNETWFLAGELRKRHPDDWRYRYLHALQAYVDAIRAVDPSLKVLVDGIDPELNGMIRKALGKKVAFLVEHWYGPWSIDAFKKDGKPVPTEGLTAEEVWNAWVNVAPVDPKTGESVTPLALPAKARDHGYPVAVTEWNWNGWWAPQAAAQAPMNSDWAKGVGAAGMLHGLMRAGGSVKLACQSMTVARSWGIGAIRLNWNGASEPNYSPTGQVVGFYSRHHGSRMLAVEAENAPSFTQPYAFGNIPAAGKVSALDVLATESRSSLYIHAINRSFSLDLTVDVDLSALGPSGRAATLYTLVGRLNNRPKAGEPAQIGREVSRSVQVRDRKLRVVLPRRSVSCLVVPYVALGPGRG